MANETTTLLQKITVGAAGTASVTFSNIPQSYTDLQIVCSSRTDGSGNLCMQFNGSTSSYSQRRLGGTGNGSVYTNTSTGQSSSPGNSFLAGISGGSSNTASTFGSASILIPNYTSSTYKSASAESNQENNGATAYSELFSGLWSNTSAITSVTLLPYDSSGKFVQYSTFTLYGIVKQGVTPAATSTPYATGGDSITFDGTNWIHTFRSTGTFTPNRALSNVDYLVVAGGAGGGFQTTNDGGSGGGGAGGLRSTVTATGGGGSLESALSLTAQSYTVTVGAGGSGSTANAVKGTQGNNSVFATVTSTGGGGGGSSGSYTGNSGGSGGGGAKTNLGGSGTSNQGYAGGRGQVTDAAGGGGGGAGAVGNNSGGDNSGGAGGVGVAVSITGSSVTYAGGGGGGGWYVSGNGGGAGGSGGGGAGGAGGGNSGSSGTANTGGGGGGAGGSQSSTANGGNGGSGIVIVRYPA